MPLASSAVWSCSEEDQQGADEGGGRSTPPETRAGTRQTKLPFRGSWLVGQLSTVLQLCPEGRCSSVGWWFACPACRSKLTPWHFPLRDPENSLHGTWARDWQRYVFWSLYVQNNQWQNDKFGVFDPATFGANLFLWDAGHLPFLLKRIYDKDAQFLSGLLRSFIVSRKELCLLVLFFSLYLRLCLHVCYIYILAPIVGCGLCLPHFTTKGPIFCRFLLVILPSQQSIQCSIDEFYQAVMQYTVML